MKRVQAISSVPIVEPMVRTEEPEAIELQAQDSSEHTTSDSTPDEYPSGLKLLLITAALILSIFLAALDSTILATAIPEITADFSSLDQVGWYGSAYFITNGQCSEPARLHMQHIINVSLDCGLELFPTPADSSQRRSYQAGAKRTNTFHSKTYFSSPYCFLRSAT